MHATCLAVLVLGGGLAGANADRAESDRASAALRGVPLEEIIVTAQRREQPAQSIPIALTALPAADLRVGQVTEVAELQLHAPSLLIMPAQGNARTATMSMRGQVEGDIVATVDPAVGLFLDGVYVARATGANLDLIDVERVEVLRGPQGSVFGRNTIGGAINVVPKRPRVGNSGFIEVTAGNYDRFELTGVLNTLLWNGSGALRLAASHKEHAGFARTVLLNRDLGDDDTDFLRAQLRLGGIQAWDLNFAVDYSDTDSSTQWITLLDAFPPATLLPAATGHPDDVLENYVDPLATVTDASHAGGYDNRVLGTTVTGTLPLADNTLKAIVATRELDLRIAETDLDGTPYDLATQFRHEQDQRQNSFELQAYGSSLEQQLDWIVGIYGFSEKVDLSTRSNALYPLAPFESVGSSTVENESRALYFQVAMPVAADLRIQAGARYVRDLRQLTSRSARVLDDRVTCNLDPAIIDQPGTCQVRFPERTFSYVPFDVSLAYTPDDGSFWYVKYSRGYRAGGYNSRALNALSALPFEPEVVDAYEIGSKTDLRNDTVRLNLALFFSDYDAIQLTRSILDDEQLPVIVNTNAGTARIKGGEVELDVSLPIGRIAFGVGHVDARYTDLDPGVIGVRTDSAFANVPEWTASLAADLPFRMPRASVNLHVNVAWHDDVFFGGHPLAAQEDVTIADARVSAALDHSNAEIALWCRNLTDRRYLARAISTGTSFVRGIPADPRTFGITVGWYFGEP
jgi:iron complex outermembrane receptor protein